MKRKTKRFTIILALAAALLLLSTCIPGPPDYEDFVLPDFTDVEYSPDGSSVTIYLDGSAPVRNSRAINLKWAQIGYDFFEVAFLSGSTVVRTVWETGHAAGISGVVRGVNYASADPTGPSSAILFVGKKSDKTLLALGSLTGTSDPTNGGATYVSADTKSVTFSVAAIDVGVRYKRDTPSADDTPSAPRSSFLTAANGPDYTITGISEQNTETRRVRIGRRYFPAFRFEAANRNVAAAYTFKVDSGGTSVTIDTFIAGIIRAGPATFATFTAPPPAPPSPVYNLDPRYPLGGGDWDYTLWPGMSLDNSTGFTFLNNQTGNQFQNPVRFQFTTRASASPETGNVFAFSFQIPVYPLTNTGNPGRWYLRPGFDSYKYDLDDGEGGTGGAILIGTGDFPESDPYLWIKAPDIEMYPHSSPSSYMFDWYGIQAELRIGNDEEYSVFKPIIAIPPQPLYGERDINLRFYVKHLNGGVNPEISQASPFSLQPYFLSGPNTPNPDYVTENGILSIIAIYDDSGVIYEEEFPLFLYLGIGGMPTADNIPPENRFIIAAHNETVGIVNNLPPGPYIFVFFDSYQMPQITLSGGSYYIIMIAAVPGVVVGSQTAGTRVFDIQNSATNSTFFLGKWPYNETLSVKGLAITSYPLTINAPGTGYFLDNNIHITVEKGPGFDTTPNDTYLYRNIP